MMDYEEEMQAVLPPYLQSDNGAQFDDETGIRTYGTLSYNKRRDCWVIHADPMVTELCKRLFPGCESSKKGEARFTAHKRIIGDLNWFMLRYPLVVRPADMERWENALAQTRQYVLQREQARLQPIKVIPSSTTFVGHLTDFQQEGLGFLLRNDRCLLADEMGLGKTVQALAAISETGKFPVLVIAPSHLIRNWQKEIARFIRKKDGSLIDVHIIQGLTPYELPCADIYLMHYLLLRGWKEVLPNLGFSTVLFDEIQELRHSGTEKYSAASLVTSRADRVIGLSGTPIYNRGAEIWNVINILDFHFLGDYESFTREWCYGYGNQIVQKPELLGEKLRDEGMMLRRLKKDVLPELPSKRRLVIPLEKDEGTYRRLMEPLKAIYQEIASLGSDQPSRRAMLGMKVEQCARRAAGISKASYVIQFVRALLDGGESVLLFAHHHEVMDLYHDGFKAYQPVFITGRETDRQKELSIERFMNGKTNLCCISLRSASGMNLQRASCVVFGELDWSPAVHSQAEDRAHRIGQTDSLLCYYLVSGSGSDSEIQDALGLKVSQFVKLMGDETPSQELVSESAQAAHDYVEKLVNRLIQENKDSR